MTDAAFVRIDETIAASRARMFRASLRTGHFVSRPKLDAAQALDFAFSFLIGAARALIGLGRSA